MVTSNTTVGLEPILFYLKPKERNVFIDVIIQNLSGNVLYFMESSGGIVSGLRINANGILELKEYSGSIWLLADAAGSDIRISLQEYVLRDKERLN